MIYKISDSDFCKLCDLIHEKSGIQLDDTKQYLVENRLSNHVHESECIGFGEYIKKLRSSVSKFHMIDEMIDAVTTNETLWFRDDYPYKTLNEILLPEYIKNIENGDQTEIKIWSCACSTGQEPYSIAITMKEFIDFQRFKKSYSEYLKIDATDISGDAISKAESGLYNKIAMGRGITEELIEQYFIKTDNEWKVKESVRQMVRFRRLNLKEPFAGILGTFDILFLRNVIIYFSDEFKRELFERIVRVMKPGGYLFLGSGEDADAYSNAFEKIIWNGGRYYQLK